MSGATFAFGPCWLCGESFAFNPDLVPSIFVDPETGRAPDLDPRGRPIAPKPDALARSVRQPLCESCVVLSNRLRAQNGRPPIEILPGAYEASETL